MKKYIPVLMKTKIFAGLSEEEISSMLSCLNTQLKTYKKGEYVLRQGNTLNHIAVLVEGGLLIQKDDYWGNRSILSEIGIGEMFGEAYTGSNNPLLNDVIAVTDSCVFFFDLSKILTSCSNSCRFHSLVIENMFFTLCEKNRQLVQKLSHITKRSTKEKLISYLSEEAKKQKSNDFDIPFNRQQLADFLSVDRSAMSNELCKMRNAGLIQFNKNHFKLL